MLSIVVPTLDEQKTIAATIAHLRRLPGESELIVVDGGSRDATRKIVEQLGVRLLRTDRGLAQQLMYGAMESRGEMVLFLHADCRLPQDAIKQLNELEKQNIDGGAFQHQYDKFHPVMALQSGINNLNARLFGRYSGEQAIFVRKKAFQKTGGIPHCIVLEDAKLSRQLRRVNAKTKLLDGPVVSSGRRFRGLGLGQFFSINWAHALDSVGVSDYRLKKFFPAVR